MSYHYLRTGVCDRRKEALINLVSKKKMGIQTQLRLFALFRNCILSAILEIHVTVHLFPLKAYFLSKSILEALSSPLLLKFHG